MIISPDEGEMLLLQYMLGLASPGNKVLHLYKNNVIPNSSSSIATFMESTETGYAPYVMNIGNWTVDLDMSGTGAIGTYPDIVFTFTEAADVYGYYVTDASFTNLLWAERVNPAPFSLGVGGGDIGISPRIECV